jgi:hypothetical protein
MAALPVPIVYDDEAGTRPLTDAKVENLKTWVIESMNNGTIGPQPIRKFGYPTDEVIGGDEMGLRLLEASIMEKKTLSWVAPFDDKEEKIIKLMIHDQALFDRVYGVEGVVRGRLMLMGKDYQTAFSMQYPYHLPRTYVVIRGEVSVMIDA